MGTHRLANQFLRINGRMNLRTSVDLVTGRSYGYRKIPYSLHVSGACCVQGLTLASHGLLVTLKERLTSFAANIRLFS